MNREESKDKMASKQEKSDAYRQIDENLKRVYGDALKEELPDKFLHLIEKLKAEDTRKHDE